MRWLTALGLTTLATRIAFAQAPAAVFIGIVTRDTLGHTVKDAEVRLVGLTKSARTDARGGFRLSAIPAGHYAVTVRALGFEPFTASIDLSDGQTLDVDLSLTPASVLLDTIKSVGTRYPGVPWMLQDFESRRRTSTTGHFLTDSTLRAHEDEVLVSLVGMFPGARLVDDLGKRYLASSRGSPGGKPVFQGGGSLQCLVAVYVDAIQVYPGGGPPPDFAHLRVSDYSGVEFYASPTEAPLQFNKTGTGCGVALLWTRQR